MVEIKDKVVSVEALKLVYDALNLIPPYTEVNNGNVLGIVDGHLAWVNIESNTQPEEPEPVPRTYNITYNLDNGITVNPNTSSITENEGYSTVITVSDGTIDSVVVTMGGLDITSTAFITANNRIIIDQVTGDIVITITKAEIVRDDIVGTITGDTHVINLNSDVLSTGNYTLYFEDADNNKLEGFDPIGNVEV